MIFYKDSNGNWHDEKDLKSAYALISPFITFGMVEFELMVANSSAIETKIFSHEPTVIEYLKMDRTIDAVYRYRDLHKCDLRTAKDMVYKIREDMHKMEKFGTLKKPIKKRKVHKDA